MGQAAQPTTSAARTDHYELTMLSAALRDGTADRHATFECFARNLPDGYRYGVIAGIGRFLDALERFTFDTDLLGWLTSRAVISPATADHLDGWRFRGTITTYREGDLYFPHSPVVTVTGTFADCLVLETLLLSILNHDSAVATKAARIVTAAQGRPTLEMGSRRTHDGAAVAAARAAWLAGFSATSNLEAGWLYDVPTMGTAAHAWTLAHTPAGDTAATERAAFDAQIATLGADTTLLVDTYDIDAGIRTAVAAARAVGAPGPGAVRIDSGDLATEAAAARALLDQLGAHATRIVVSGDLDEYRVGDLTDAPIDAYGVGTRLVTGLPAPGFVYKLTEIADTSGRLLPVAKSSAGKATTGGRKVAVREVDDDGYATCERVVVRRGPDLTTFATLGARALQTVAFTDGERTYPHTLADDRAFHAQVLRELRPGDLNPTSPLVGPAIPTRLSQSAQPATVQRG